MAWRRLAFLPLLAVLVLLGGLLFAQDAKKDSETKKDPAPSARIRGTLPPNFSRLGLSEEQKQKVYKAQNDADDKVAELEAQIKKIRTDEKKAIEALLTDAQKARLKEIIKEKGGIGTEDPKSDKPGDK